MRGQPYIGGLHTQRVSAGYYLAFPVLSICSRQADAITEGVDGRLYFAEPFVAHMTMGEFLSRLSSGKVLKSCAM